MSHDAEPWPELEVVSLVTAGFFQLARRVVAYFK